MQDVMETYHFNETKPELAEAIRQSVMAHHEHLADSLADLRTTASLLVGLCAPASVGAGLYASQNGLPAAAVGAGFLMASALCAGMALMPVNWATRGNGMLNWYVLDSGVPIAPELVANTTWMVLTETYNSTKDADKNGVTLRGIARWTRWAVTCAMAAPVLSALVLGLQFLTS